MIGPGCGFAVNTFCRDGTPEEIREMLALGPAVEAAGFDSVWVGDHVLWHTPIVDSLSMLAAYVATTERVTVGTAIYLLGLRQPVVAAKSITSLSAMSEGRLALGVGAGGENEEEFTACGVPHAERGRALDAGLRTLLAQWDPAADGPKVEPPGPPVPLLVGGRSNAARRRIATFQAAWLAAFVSPRRIAEELVLLEEQRGGEVPVALNIYLRTERDGAAAEREAAAFLAHTYAMEPEPLMRYSVAGTPESCAEELAGYAEAGVRHFVLRPAAWEQTAQLEQWTADLLPLMRQIELRGA